jgi:hypothetical protein
MFTKNKLMAAALVALVMGIGYDAAELKGGVKL